MIIAITDGEGRILLHRGVGEHAARRKGRLPKAWCDRLEREIARQVEEVAGAGEGPRAVVISIVIGGRPKGGR